MFTGLIEEVGTIRNVTHGAQSASLVIAAQTVLEGTRVGDSICVNGVCLTVTKLADDCFAADAMPETLQRSTLGALSAGSRVNLERAVRVGDRLGGHFVSGHIDGTARVVSLQKDDNAIRMGLSAPSELCRYVVEKGSVALDGVSLTVTEVATTSFGVSVIPHTMQSTDLIDKHIGDLLNVECDMIGKYVEKLAQPQVAATGITRDFLAENGF